MFESFLFKKKVNLQNFSLKRISFSSFLKQTNLINNFFSEDKMNYEINIIHLYLYESFKTKIFLLKSDFIDSVILKRNGKFYFYAPKIKQKKFWYQIINQNSSIEFLRLTPEWIKHNPEIFLLKEFDLKARSLEEALYSVEKLTELKGGDFSSLRNLKNKTKNSFFLKDLKDLNYTEVLLLFKKWRHFQGPKYSVDRFNKEKRILKSLFQSNFFLNKIKGFGIYLNYKLIGVSVFFIHPNNEFLLVNYITKALNKPEWGGCRGASDFLYIKMIEFAKYNKLSYINDGEMGHETGTRAHKKKFKPVFFLQTFDLLKVK